MTMKSKLQYQYELSKMNALASMFNCLQSKNAGHRMEYNGYLNMAMTYTRQALYYHRKIKELQ